MTTTTRQRARRGAAIAVLSLAGTLLVGCSSHESSDTTAGAPETAAAVADTTAAATETTVAAAAADTTAAAAAADTTMAAADTTAMAGMDHSGDSMAMPATSDAVLPNGAATKIVASTSWVGAMAKLAGATDISVLAPNNIVHPPDYDPKPSDLAAVANGELILLAGFEGFAKRMSEAASSTAKVDNVATAVDPAKLGPEVMRIAAMLGTTDTATANVAAYTKAWNDASATLKAKLGTTPQVVIAHAFVAEWAGFAGWTPVAAFGPAPLTANDVAKLAAMKPTVVLENSHMPGGKPIADAAGAKFVSLINFPGDDLDLTQLISKNAATITSALAG